MYQDMKFIDTNTWPLEVISLRIISNRKKGASAVCDGDSDSDSDSDEESPESTNTDAVKAFMESFGVEQMRRLTEHYSALLLGKHAISEEADRPADAGSLEVIIQQEWECFKADLLRGDIGIERIASSSHSEFWRFMRMHYQERYPWFLRLVLIILLVPIGSAECERMFSLMNRLKTDLRNRMKNGRLNDLMTVNRLAPSTLSDEELDEVIDFWEADCKTGRYTSYFK